MPLLHPAFMHLYAVVFLVHRLELQTKSAEIPNSIWSLLLLAIISRMSPCNDGPQVHMHTYVYMLYIYIYDLEKICHQLEHQDDALG